MHICFDYDIHAPNAIELDLFLFVLLPVTHPCKIFAMSAVFFVACEEGDLVSTVTDRNQNAKGVSLTFCEDCVFGQA